MIDATMAALGILAGIFVSIMWQEHVTPWLRKKKAYRQRVKSRAKRRATAVEKIIANQSKESDK